jgi:hypothetical protein
MDTRSIGLPHDATLIEARSEEALASEVSKWQFDPVGFTATISNGERPALTRRLEALGEPLGFTGKALGSASRWARSAAANGSG